MKAMHKYVEELQQENHEIEKTIGRQHASNQSNQQEQRILIF